MAKWRGSLLVAVIIAQILLLYWTHGVTKIMREEWPRVVKATPVRVYVIEQERFWGPVNALVPKSCREMDKWQAITHTDDEAAPTQPPPSPKTATRSAHVGQDKDHRRTSSDHDKDSRRDGSEQSPPRAPTRQDLSSTQDQEQEAGRRSSPQTQDLTPTAPPSPSPNDPPMLLKGSRAAAAASPSPSLQPAPSPASAAQPSESSLPAPSPSLQAPPPSPPQLESGKASDQVEIDLCGRSCSGVVPAMVAVKDCSSTRWSEGCDPEKDTPPPGFTRDSTISEMCPQDCQASPKRVRGKALPYPLSEAGQKADKVTQQAILTGVEDVPGEERLRSGEDATRRLAHDIIVERCNETMHFEGVGHWHRYFSMIHLSNYVTGGTPTGEELHKARIRSHHALWVGIVICMLMKYSLKITDICAECCGHQYVQLWNQGRTTFDKLLESLLLHGISIIFTLAMQMTLCGLFLTFWREDHFIMTYLPGLAFTMFGISLLAFCVFMIVDRLRGYMARCSNRYIYCFWITWALWMWTFAVPMIGYCVYSVNFMWTVRDLGWLEDQDDLFSKEFVHASKKAGWITGGFVLVAFADLVVILLLDLDAGQPNYQ